MTKACLSALAAFLLGSLIFAPLSSRGAPASSRLASTMETALASVNETRPLPGGLNDVPVLNSNSPEMVQTEGILVSTLPPKGRAHPEAHLNFLFRGRFDIFAHHIARSSNPDAPPLYLGIVLFNPGKQSVKVDLLQAASYLSQPDAPFVDLPPLVDNDKGTIYSGPGDRVTDDFLHGWSQSGWTTSMNVPPRQASLLVALPIPVQGLTPPLNGRSALIKLQSHGVVYAATLALFAHTDLSGQITPPTEADWFRLLEQGDLAGPREQAPSKPGAPGPVSYGRVAGVSIGDQWTAHLNPIECAPTSADRPIAPFTVSFPLSTVVGGTLGSDQIQSAVLAVREPGTAYAAHGNYGVLYNIDMPLTNQSSAARALSIRLQSPLKSASKENVLRFAEHPSGKVFFRGTLKCVYEDEPGSQCAQYVHITQKEGEAGQPLLVLTVPPHSKRKLKLSWLYPPDATPPQVLTLNIP